MKKPSLADALARKEAAPAAAPEPAALPPAVEPSKMTDNKIATTIRIDVEKLTALKIIAAKRGLRVNDLLLEGAEHVLKLNANLL